MWSLTAARHQLTTVRAGNPLVAEMREIVAALPGQYTAICALVTTHLRQHLWQLDVGVAQRRIRSALRAAQPQFARRDMIAPEQVLSPADAAPQRSLLPAVAQREVRRVGGKLGAELGGEDAAERYLST